MFYRLDEQRRRTGHVRETRRINLGAVLDTTCSKCGGKGMPEHSLSYYIFLPRNVIHCVIFGSPSYDLDGLFLYNYGDMWRRWLTCGEELGRLEVS